MIILRSSAEKAPEGDNQGTKRSAMEQKPGKANVK